MSALRDVKEIGTCMGPMAREKAINAQIYASVLFVLILTIIAGAALL